MEHKARLSTFAFEVQREADAPGWEDVHPAPLRVEAPPSCLAVGRPAQVLSVDRALGRVLPLGAMFAHLPLPPFVPELPVVERFLFFPITVYIQYHSAFLPAAAPLTSDWSRLFPDPAKLPVSRADLVPPS
uniref:Uncharacterized protein n=1 Tax=Pipistrellus kuhlii TaxID=59472 RepID=A0A7J7S0C1_PIPKU|nr:hypothetical protein mPipKuh1_010218 [Pipistrellus kuhlii]